MIWKALKCKTDMRNKWACRDGKGISVFYFFVEAGFDVTKEDRAASRHCCAHVHEGRRFAKVFRIVEVQLFGWLLFDAEVQLIDRQRTPIPTTTECLSYHV